MSETTVTAFTPGTELGRFVAARVSNLQETYLAGSPATQADLAKLRRAAGKAPGSVAEVWELTLGGVPQYGSHVADEPSPNEWACHTALTLYSLHQRSKSLRMHQPGVGLGEAVRRLRAGDDPAISRRFSMVATATDLAEVSYHARSLLGQLRDANVPLDYGRLADQLVWLQIPSRAPGVRLTWGREFHRTVNQSNDTTGVSS
ncbi:MAG TPA: type I-E CRISPR-associated protein Cse2/CasB [Candidatus Acidoferrum sp.]|jgi:CRISPR system Cascade subunit CasB|nr:type I-E CRISPR-associated protein Cse2/CasB [Candidatus Acidoferrum sp.]